MILCFSEVKSQIAFYDALALKNYFKNGSININNSSENDILFLKSTLSEYLPASTLNTLNGKPDNIFRDTIINLFKNNPFIQIDTTHQTFAHPISLKFEIGGSSSHAFSAIGGLDVTNFADGVAKFLVKRFKEELTLTFFQKFEADINNSQELGALFPQTKKVLSVIDNDIYQFSAYLNILREAFVQDLANMYTNFKVFTQLDKYKNYFNDHPELKTIITSSLYIIEQYAAGIHAGKVLENYHIADLQFKDPIVTQNIQSSVALMQAFSKSFNAVSSDHYWVSADSVRSFLENDTLRNIYFGLLYQKYGSIAFKLKNGSSLRFDDLLKEAKQSSDSLAQYKLFAETFINKAEEVSEYLTGLQGKKKADIDYNDYYKLYNSSLDLLQQAFAFVDLPYVNAAIDSASKNDIKIQSNRWLGVARSAADLYIDIRTTNYSSAILNASSVVDTILLAYHENDSAKVNKFKTDLLKYGTFAATVTTAQNSDDVEAAIEAIALPVGSYSVKRESHWNIALNAYAGGYMGYEKIIGLKNGNMKFNSFGITAPVGISFSIGKQKCWGPFPGSLKKFDGNWSYSIFVSLIDVGALAAFRFNNDSIPINNTPDSASVSQSPSIQLKNIISPGIFLSLGIPKLPISINLGVQLGPNLRSVSPVNNSSANLNFDNNMYLRYSISAVVDIPVLNFYTKSQ